MLAATWPEPVGEPAEVRLVHGVQHLDDRPLDNLVLQRRDTERPQPPVRLRDVRPPRRHGPVTPALYPLMQVPQVRFQALPVVLPPHPVHPRRGLRAYLPVGPPQAFNGDMVQKRGEPRVLIPSRYLAHTVQRT